jgi:HEAT repeat protein
VIEEELINRLKSPDAATRKRALDDVAKVTDPDNLACLIEAIGDPAAGVRAHARKLLRRLTRRDYGQSREEWQGWWRTYAHLSCQNCKKRLFDHRLYYRVKADVTAEPREVIITDEDLAVDPQAKLDQLAEEMKSMPREDLEDEVWVRLEYYLCTGCKKSYVKDSRKPPRPAD